MATNDCLPAALANNTLAQLLLLCEQLNTCSDIEIQDQLQQMAFSCPEQLVQPVRLLLHSSLFLQQQRTAVAADTPVPSPATPSESLLSLREREVLALLREGYTLPQIGERLFISPATVNNHCARMREKLGLRGRNALMGYAVTNKE